MYVPLRTAVAAALTLAAEPFRWWHETLLATAEWVEPTPTFGSEDYARASAVIARAAAAGTTTPQEQQ